MEKIKILVVDDSSFMRKVISDILNSVSDFEVVDTARNGEDAVEKTSRLQPDVVTMDVEMPVKDGIQALEEIMDKHPTAVIMVSSLTKEGADVTLKALELGAVEFIAKPGGSISLKMDEIRHHIIEKVRIASKSSPKAKGIVQDRYEHPIIRKEIPRTPAAEFTLKTKIPYPLILIGTSTGGPRALHTIMAQLDGNIKAPVLIVQHMPATFTKSLAARLDGISKFAVKEAEDGDVLTPGKAYLAPGGQQMGIRVLNGKPVLTLRKEDPVNGHRPSVDYLFKSAAEHNFSKIIAVILTGMGYDGRNGMVELYKQGAITIAESEETCIIYGMPKAAVEANAVEIKAPLGSIAAEISSAYKRMT